MEFLEVHQKNGQMVNSSAAKWNPPQSDSIYKLNLAISHTHTEEKEKILKKKEKEKEKEKKKRANSVGFGLLIRNNRGDVFAASCVRVEKTLKSICTATSLVRIAFTILS